MIVRFGRGDVVSVDVGRIDRGVEIEVFDTNTPSRPLTTARPFTDEVIQLIHALSEAIRMEATLRIKL